MRTFFISLGIGLILIGIYFYVLPENETIVTSLEENNAIEKKALSTREKPSSTESKGAAQKHSHKALSPTNSKYGFMLNKLYTDLIEDDGLARRVHLTPYVNSPKGIRMQVKVDEIPVLNEIVEFRSSKTGQYSLASSNSLISIKKIPDQFPNYSSRTLIDAIEAYFNLTPNCQLKRLFPEEEKIWLRTNNELIPSVRFKLSFRCERHVGNKTEDWFYSPTDSRRIKTVPTLH